MTKVEIKKNAHLKNVSADHQKTLFFEKIVDMANPKKNEPLYCRETNAICTPIYTRCNNNFVYYCYVSIF